MYGENIHKEVMNNACDDSVPVLCFKLTHLTRSRQEMNLNIWICQAIEIHRLQTLVEAIERDIVSELLEFWMIITSVGHLLYCTVA